jgi:hypothetical protein
LLISLVIFAAANGWHKRIVGNRQKCRELRTAKDFKLKTLRRRWADFYSHTSLPNI